MSHPAPSAAADPDEILKRALNHFAPQQAPRSAWTFRLAALGFLLGAAAFVMEAVSLSRGVGWAGHEAPRTIDSMAPVPEQPAFGPPPPSPPPVAAEGSSSRPPPAMPPAPSPEPSNATTEAAAEPLPKKLTMLEAADAIAIQQQGNASVAAPGTQATFQVLWGESSAASASQSTAGKRAAGGSASGSADGSAGDGGGGGGGGGPTVTAAPRLAAGERPNLLLMVADDLAAGELGEYRKVQGQAPHGLTPNIDSLAHKGTLFMQAHEDGQSGRLGEAIAGLHGLISLHLKAWGCPPHS